MLENFYCKETTVLKTMLFVMAMNRKKQDRKLKIETDLQMCAHMQEWKSIRRFFHKSFEVNQQ